jgi:hypothetical protein
MAIPYVRHRHGRYLHTYIARMFSGVPTSVFVGNTSYGFAKSLACMRWQGSTFIVSDIGQQQMLVHADISPIKAAKAERRATMANLESMHAALALPILGRRADGSFVSSYFELDFDAGSVEPAESWISIDAPIVDGMAPRRVSGAPAGSVRITDVIWRLSWPLRPQF